MLVTTGLDRILGDKFHIIRGKRLGLIVNPTSVTSRLQHTVDALLSAGATVRMLFGPEHGIRGEAQDMIPVGHQLDEVTGLPVASLYGDSFRSLAPHEEDLKDLDAVVFDIQDVGSRYYTYVATLLLTMKKLSGTSLEVIVLDRPNPIGGANVEGPSLLPGYESFVGLLSVSVRHGMTAGELATMARAIWNLDVNLTVVECKGWQRDMFFDETGLPWVLPSPNMPTLETALVYPGGCLIEGTNLSEGRGTTRPFELVGAPFLPPGGLCRNLSACHLPGVAFRRASFLPAFHKHQGQVCHGVQIHVLDRTQFRPFLTGVAILREAMELSEGRMSWRTQAYEFVTEKLAIDLLFGNSIQRHLLEQRASLDDIAASWQEEEAGFAKARKPFLLY